MVTYPHSPGTQAMPYRVTDTWGTYSIFDIPPRSLMDFLYPTYNRLTKEQRKRIENLFIIFL
jgi:hypothetical protein